MRAALLAAVVALGTAAAFAQPRPQVGVPGGGWVTTTCWIEPRWFESLRSGPVDYCKKSLRYRPGKLDCLTFTDQICWALNPATGEYQQLRSDGIETLIICPDGPEAPTCPRMGRLFRGGAFQ
jgi:hypothetical protein